MNVRKARLVSSIVLSTALSSALLLAGCSGSSSSDGSMEGEVAGLQNDDVAGADSSGASGSDVSSNVGNSAGNSAGNNAGNNADANNTDTSADGNLPDSSAGNGSGGTVEEAGDASGDNNASLNDPVGDDALSDGSDPLIQNTVATTFDIQVPRYQSDALQVRLTWGDIDTTAAWVGDEFWAVTETFPVLTTDTLTVFFNDDNGAITLASFQTEFETGSNAAETVQILADQFDSERWDDDNDGLSNLAESIAGTSPVDAQGPARILLFSETRGFRHDSIPSALQALEALADEMDYQTDLAADSDGVFTEANLARYDAVAWVLTSGDVLNEAEQAVFENFIRSGGGYVGIHAASDTEYDWPWYGDLVGAYFQRHPQIQSATMNVENGTHPSTAHLGNTWVRTDEWYDFRSNPRARVNVLLSLDETTYMGGEMGEDHPIAWYRPFDGGRSWYTGGGHTVGSYAEEDFRAHLIGGIRYVVGAE